MFMYKRVPHRVPEIWRKRAATSISADSPSGKLPTTLVRRRISFMIRSSGLLVHRFRLVQETALKSLKFVVAH